MFLIVKCHFFLVTQSACRLFLLEAPKGVTSLATIAKKVMSEAAAEAEAVEWLGASVSWVDGHVAEGIRPSRCERGDDDT